MGTWKSKRTMNGMTRRDALKSMGMMAAAAGAPVLLTACGGARQSVAMQARSDSQIAEKVGQAETKNLAEQAVENAKKFGATYADARVVIQREQFISTEDRRVAYINDDESGGIGIRVVANGSLGFAATRNLTPAGVEAMTKLAVEVGRASASIRRGPPVSWAEETPYREHFTSPRIRDPFEIACDEKTRLLLAANELMLKVAGIGKATSYMHFTRDRKTLASSDGSLIEIDMLRTQSGIDATAIATGDAQSRSYRPPPFAGGYELIEQAAYGSHAQRVANQAIEKLKAKPVADGKFDLVLLPSHLYLTIHESIGHATEMDRVLGMEESLSGGSFATLDQLGKLRYGSPKINIRALNTRPGFLASTGFDDDGVQCQDWDIIRDGVLVGYSTNRETAKAMGHERSLGACRADSWSSIPILRMANICLMPGKERLALDDLTADTADGILIDGEGSFSIDNRRLNFQFGGDAFWEIKNGKKTQMLRDVTYQAITPEFWGACDAVCDEREWQPFGTFYCGKGDPMQTSQISHACSPARFRGITVRRAV